MAKKDFDKKALDDFKKSLKETHSVQQDLESSMSKYTNAVEKLLKLQKNLQHIESVKLKQQENITDLENELISLLDSKIGKTKVEKKEIRNQVKEINKKIKAQKISLSITDDNLNGLRKQTDEFKKQVQSVDKMNLSFKAVGTFLKSTPSLIKQGFGKLRGFGLMDMDKSIRNARLEMGLFSEQGKSFYDNISNAALSTNELGVDIGDLAKMQSQYSNEIGRSVQFTEASSKAMAELAKGTNLGVEGAASFASEMDNLNISIKDTRDYVEDTVNSTHSMGLNTSKVLKNLQNNLKLANKYNFKNGIKGLAHMAQLSTKFKMDMGSVAGMADKLFDIEGAVDMSAQLQVMGGEWAKLADPFKLMYQAREDMDGLFESVVNATKGAATFVKETGEFKLSGMELHRLKKVAEATGLDFEQLATSAKQAAKFSKIEANISGKIDPELKQFISTTAEYDKSKGQYQIMVGSEPKLINTLTANDKAMLKSAMQQKNTLEEQAKNAQNFDDAFKNTVNTLKVALLPFVKSLNEKIMPAFNNFNKTLKNSGFLTTVKDFASKIGSFVGTVGKWVLDNPFKSLVAALGLGVAEWVAKGVALGKGFMMSTNGFGNNTSGGIGGGLTDMFSGKGGKGKKGWSTGKKLGVGMGLGVAGMAADAGRGMMNDPNSDLGKGLGVGGSALQGAGMGSMFGPWGMGIGAALGGGYGAYNEFFADKNKPTKEVNDGVIQNGKVKAITNEKDVMMAMKPNGVLANTIGNSNSTASSKSMDIKFQPLKIEFGDINIKMPDGLFKLNLMKDQAFMNDFTKKVQETLRMAINGGKLNPNPI